VADESTTLYKFELQDDGSFRGAFDTTNRGIANTAITHRFWFSKVDGGPRFARYNKQWRTLWVLTEGEWSSETPLQLIAHMDGASTSINVGNTITSATYTESAWVVGTNDKARYIIPGLELVTGGSYSNEDSRIRAFGVEGVSPTVYRAQIDLTPRGLTSLGTGKSYEDLLKNLRDLKGGVAVTIVAPDTNTGFTGYVVGLDEQLVNDEEGEGIGYIVNALITRYDWDGA
jgi:hypothetical protein